MRAIKIIVFRFKNSSFLIIDFLSFWILTDWILSEIKKKDTNIIIHQHRYIIITPLIFRLHILFLYNIKETGFITLPRGTPQIFFPFLIYTPLIPLQSKFFYFKIFLIIQFRLQVSIPRLCEIRISSKLYMVSKALEISRQMSKAFIP